MVMRGECVLHSFTKSNPSHIQNSSDVYLGLLVYPKSTMRLVMFLCFPGETILQQSNYPLGIT